MARDSTEPTLIDLAVPSNRTGQQTRRDSYRREENKTRPWSLDHTGFCRKLLQAFGAFSLAIWVTAIAAKEVREATDFIRQTVLRPFSAAPESRTKHQNRPRGQNRPTRGSIPM